MELLQKAFGKLKREAERMWTKSFQESFQKWKTET